MTLKLWNIMKGEMLREFRELTFQAKVRSQLLKIKLIRAYHGCVNKSNFASGYIMNSSSMDSETTMDGGRPSFSFTNNLREHGVDHNEQIEIIFADKQMIALRTCAVPLGVYVETFLPYTNDYLVIDLPEGQDVLLGMPYLDILRRQWRQSPAQE
ncbi:hypothetical protein PHMEG_00031422 [Phytophthora megakarya]|uniref:Uncharacterized protein n=1 Tax=Phytophthora megakarya TaxID=4795 RepID=A0A225UXR2_9STRA|nr:hypothetical protein PHMEG_00031422 [Phytophthora megakarya]